MRGTARGIIASLLALSTAVPTAFAAVTSNTSQQRAKISVDNSVLSNPFKLAASDGSTVTTYMPMYYVDQALAKAGYKATWDGTTWALTTQNGNLDFSSIPVGTGNTTITINGKVVKKINTFAQHDPAAGRNSAPTTYFPIYYVKPLFEAAGISAAWDGNKRVWGLTSPLTIKTSVTYGPATGLSDINKNVTIVGTNATLQNCKVSGNIYVNPGADGSVCLKNVTVTGSIVVLSGAHSIHLDNVTAPVLAISSSCSVHVVSEGTTAIGSTQVADADIQPVTLEQTGGTLGHIQVNATQPVTLTGTQPFTSVSLNGGTQLTVTGSTTVSQLNVTGSNTQITVSSGAAITGMNVANVAGTKVNNDGTIGTLTNNGATSDITVSGQGSITQTVGSPPTIVESEIPPSQSFVTVTNAVPTAGFVLDGQSVSFSVTVPYLNLMGNNAVITAQIGSTNGKGIAIGSQQINPGSGHVTISGTVSVGDLKRYADSTGKVYLCVGMQDSTGNYHNTWHVMNNYTYSFTLSKQGTPTGVAPVPNTMQVTWALTRGILGYGVHITDGSTDKIVDVGRNNSIDLATLGLPTGDYNVSVVAKGDGLTTTDSDPSSPVTVHVQVMDKPTGLTADHFAVNWLAVSGASAYLVNVYDSSGTFVMSTGVDANTTTFNIGSLGLSAGSYNVKVVAEGDALSTTNSAESDPTTVTLVALQAPGQPTLDNSYTYLNWPAVTGATGYVVNFYSSGSYVGRMDVGTATSLDITTAPIPAGMYQATVIAKGDEINSINSDESQPSDLFAVDGLISASYTTVIAPATEQVGHAFVIAVVPKDTHGLAVGSGQDVKISNDGTYLTSAVWNDVNQDYEVTYTPTSAGTITFTVNVNGIDITQTATITVS